jgi:16S rRNA (guanine527-N7)-methyltransferase
LDELVDRAADLASYTDLLQSEGVTLGLLAPDEPERLLVRHIFESCALLPILGEVDSCVDVGPGAGLPGLVLSIAARIPVTLVERNATAASFLRRVVGDLGPPATVVQAPAESAAHGSLREAVAVAVSRALAPPAVALELMLPFVRCGGCAAVLVGPSHEEARRAAAEAAVALGGGEPRYLPLEVPGAEAGLWVMITEKVDQTPERYPRRSEIPRRRPLGGGVTGVK